MICFVIKSDERYDTLVKSAVQMLKIFRLLLENVILIITHSEKVNNLMKAEIEHIFQTKYKIKNIIFTQANDDPSLLNLTLDKLAKSMENINDGTILTENLFNEIDAVDDIALLDIRDKYKEIFYKILNLHKEEFNKSNDKELKRELYF